VTDPRHRETLMDLAIAGAAAGLRAPAVQAELLAWTRFSHAEAMASRDGLFAGAAGNPAMPGALGRGIHPHLLTLDREADRMMRQIRSSAGLAVFASARADAAAWVEAGRAAQRFCLQATAMGVRTGWVDHPAEASGLQDALAAWLGLAPARPGFILRFGRGGPELPRSLRRPVAEVIA
jgi:nitroreductase